MMDVRGRINVKNDHGPNSEKKILMQALTDELSCESGLFSRTSHE